MMNKEKSGVSVKLIINIIIAVLLIAFMIANRQMVDINLFVGTISTPIFMVILVSVILGWIMKWLVPKFKK
ncbi:hypothetical protein X560_0005 [Listeria fleischmannii 1991]|uniref:Uncharacterized integral membrane protein n=3 Tax=Listeria fleischmannii TaxID=1069827 RepID=A0A2X3HGV0_9LIST|nr:LapA family protein [Listeria fleischmannii]KMT61425.1 hypothetical protein X560_0005 [Listeria fleischmannii 1991]SQC70414.1 Uncharacterized integral membrane protein [Listeria fleischmannii subsp. fleischmannii]